MWDRICDRESSYEGFFHVHLTFNLTDYVPLIAKPFVPEFANQKELHASINLPKHLGLKYLEQRFCVVRPRWSQGKQHLKGAVLFHMQASSICRPKGILLTTCD